MALNERQVIEDRVRRKRAEVATLEEKLKAAKIYLNALQDILKDVDRTSGGGEASPDAEARLRAGSSVARAREIIAQRGEPVHVDDLLVQMGKKPDAAGRASLVGSLAAYVRRNEIFTRTAPNTFGLLELGHTENEEEEANREPPAGFGRSPVQAVGFDVDDDVPF